jgi:hypothetical protein
MFKISASAGMREHVGQQNDGSGIGLWLLSMAW